MSQTKTRLKCRPVVVAMLAACAPAVALAQIYKCPDAGGRMTIQQAPCAGGTKMEVKPASGPAVKPSPSAAGDKPISEADRLNALSDASARERRKMSLEERVVPGAWVDIQHHRETCARTLDKLRADQYKYEQNLYGKTHAAQMASEMAATAALCDPRDRELTATFQRALDACKAVGGCVRGD